uniref:Xylanolytic transcriptional activator regulatory domain-containing protein n=1 Tax=Pyricularia oryzae (strain P131) TaxID=1143193 RepID=L7JCM4_PYRO1
MPTQLPPIAPTDASSDDPGPSDIPPPYSAALDPTASESVTRRGSPELYPAEIGGQYVEQTSGLAFLHRAHVRMISKSGTAERDGAALGSTMGTSSAEGLYPSYGVQAGSSSQLLITAGDKPILASSSLPVQVVSGRSDGDGGNLLLPQRATSLMAFYFDKCVVTYRILHRQSVEGWLRAMELELGHVPPSGTTSFPAIGGAKAAVVLTVLAIAIQKRARMSLHGTPGRDGSRDEDEVLRDCDPYFSMAQSLVQAETGLPKLESAQARLLQVLYLLQTSRVNQAWYLLGTVSQLISALGLHRKPSRNSRPGPQRLRTDYIQQQCGRRTFWVLYTIDVYLSVVLGRPRYLHDDNIDQAYPDSVADENMTPDGERNKGRTSMDDIGCDDSPMEAVVQHAKLGRIIAATCREVYAIGPTPSRRDRLRLALGFDVRLHEWRAALPPLLGAVRPSSLVPSFRRQALVDSIAGDESLFHAFWWSHYVTFCAIAVTFVWEIQQASASGSRPDEISPGPLDPGAAEQLFVLAERCHAHLSRVLFADSFGRRYTVILEELRLEARHQSAKSTPAVAGTNGNVPVVMQADSVPGADVDNVMVSSGDYNADRGGEQGLAGGFNDWAPIDWLELDAACHCTIGSRPSHRSAQRYR